MNILSKNTEVIHIEHRLDAIRKGAGFGERDIFSVDAYYPYTLIEVISSATGDILVKDLSIKHPKPFVSNVMIVDIEAIDFIKE